MIEISENKLRELLASYFDVDKGDSYYYVLQRDKEAFHYGTVDTDDFEEFDDYIIDDILEYITDRCKED